jgi:FK506-binding nuclear protein
MAALDPSAVPLLDADNKIPRATLKLIRERRDPAMDFGSDDDEDDDDLDDIAAIKARLAGIISEDDSEMSEDDDSEEEKNGGPSDPVKAKKAKQAALTKKLQEELDAEMDIDSIPNGVNGKSSKGKAKALDGELSSDDDDEEDSEDGEEVEEFVLCTLDPEKVSNIMRFNSNSPH